MAETTLPLKLSGEEIRKALVDTIDQELKKNCFLNPNGAYDSFAGKIEVDIMLHDTGLNMHLEASKEVGSGTRRGRKARALRFLWTRRRQIKSECRLGRKFQRSPVMPKATPR